MELILIAVALVVGIVVGAFSHKYLASEVTKVTGLDPNAVASKVNSAVDLRK